MQNKSAPNQSGIVIVTDPDEDFKSLTIPAEGYGQTFTLDLTRGDNKLEKPRKIQFDDIPSASIITLSSKSSDWWIKFKTTHHTAQLSSRDVHYHVNTYDKDDFLIEGLGFVVVDKSSKPAKRDTLATVTVELSRKP